MVLPMTEALRRSCIALDASRIGKRSPTPETTMSEHEDLLRRLAGWEHTLANEESDMVIDAAAAIRKLEAQVHRLEVTKAGLWDESRKDYATMRELRADRDRLDLECARLTIERDRLAAEVAALREDALRLEHLFNCEPAHSDSVSELYLRIINGERPTMDEVRAAIDAARRAGEGEANG